MGFHLKNSASNGAPGATLDVILTGVTAGDLIVAELKWEVNAVDATFAEVTGGSQAADGYGPSQLSGVGSTRTRFAYILAGTGGTITYRMTTNSAAEYRVVVVYAYTYTGTASLDGTPVSVGGDSEAPNSGNITTVGTDGVAFGSFGNTDAFTISAELINGVAADQVEPANPNALMWSKAYTSGFTGAASATLSVGQGWVCGVIAFKFVAGGAVVPVFMNQYRQRGN